MERVVFVEVLNRHGEVVHRQRLAQLPASIGRAYSNDVILSDPHVDPSHARLLLDEDGSLVIEDLGSVNGLRSDHQLRREPRIRLTSPAVVRLGRTQLRVVAGDQAVPPAVSDPEPTGRLAAVFASPRAMAAVLAGGTLLMAVSVWLADYEAKTSDELLGPIVALAAGVVTWAAIWAVAGRIMVHRGRFWQHLTLSTLFFAALWLAGFVGSWAAFYFKPEIILGVEELVVFALFLGVIVIHAGLASNASMKRRVLFSLALGAGLGVLALAGDQAFRNDFGLATVAVEATLKPVPDALVPAGSPDRFIDGMTSLKRTVDRLED